MYTHPSPFDPDSVVPYRRSIQHSTNYAKTVRKLICEVGIHNEVREDEMNYFKRDLSRLKYSQLEREFKAIIDSGGFNFIDDYIEEAYPHGYFRD